MLTLKIALLWVKLVIRQIERETFDLQVTSRNHFDPWNKPAERSIFRCFKIWGPIWKAKIDLQMTLNKTFSLYLAILTS